MELKLSQNMIIQAAFAILAETNELSKLSMRSLAQKTEVKAPALYWHFKNKQELLQKMAEAMENELVIPDQHLPWQERLVQFMENYYDLFTQFPCGAELEIHTLPTYPGRHTHLEVMSQILVEVGFSTECSRQAIFALHNLLIGQLMDDQHEQKLRQKIIARNHLLKDTIFPVKNDVKKSEEGKANCSAHTHDKNKKQLFLNNVAIYLQGLSLQKKQ
ncbi:TetR family transcriptional regulator [Enterococcus ratti]|nr:TetR family transcriptional regulator [Enterococcus ratti]